MKDAVKHAVKHIVKQSKTPAAESAPETASFERTPKAMLLGAVLVLLGGVLWGINATVSKLLMADYHADPLWIACVRELAAGALFLACAGVRTPKLLAGAVRDRRSYPMLLFAALTCVLFVQVSYLSAIDWTNSGTATVLQTLNLLFVLAYVCIRGRRWPGLRESIGVALAFTGTVLIATGGDLSTLKLPLVGLLWGLADAACTAALSILPAKLVARWGNLAVNGIMFVISGLVLTPFVRPWASAAAGLVRRAADGVHRCRRHVRRILAVPGRRDAYRLDARHNAGYQRADRRDDIRRAVGRGGVHAHGFRRLRDDHCHGVPRALARVARMPTYSLSRVRRASPTVCVLKCAPRRQVRAHRNVNRAICVPMCAWSSFWRALKNAKPRFARQARRRGMCG